MHRENTCKLAKNPSTTNPPNSIVLTIELRWLSTAYYFFIAVYFCLEVDASMCVDIR